MISLKKTLTAAGLGTALFAGGIFGAVGTNVTSADAQTVATVQSEMTADDSVPSSDGQPSESQRKQRQARHEERRADKEAQRAALADILGITEEELSEARSSGVTLTETGQAQGVDRQVLVDFFTKAASTRIDGAVDDGKMTEEQAAEKRAKIDEKVDAMLDGGSDGHGKRGKHGKRSKHGESGERGQGAERSAPAVEA